jgi:hypothetical protein
MMKRFDFAADVSKQLITISAAIITVLITFYEKFLSHREFVFFTIVTTLCLLIASIVCGIAALGGIVNLAERQERAGAPFIALGGSSAKVCTMFQQVAFGLALLAFVAAAAFDHYFPTPPTPAAQPAVPSRP